MKMFVSCSLNSALMTALIPFSSYENLIMMVRLIEQQATALCFIIVQQLDNPGVQKKHINYYEYS